MPLASSVHKLAQLPFAVNQALDCIRTFLCVLGVILNYTSLLFGQVGKLIQPKPSLSLDKNKNSVDQKATESSISTGVTLMHELYRSVSVSFSRNLLIHIYHNKGSHN